MAKMYYEKDCELSYLDGKKIGQTKLLYHYPES